MNTSILHFTNGLLTSVSDNILSADFELCPVFHDPNAGTLFPADSSLYYEVSSEKNIIYLDCEVTYGNPEYTPEMINIKMAIPKTIRLKLYQQTAATKGVYMAYSLASLNDKYVVFKSGAQSAYPIFTCSVEEKEGTVQLWTNNLLGNIGNNFNTFCMQATELANFASNYSQVEIRGIKFSAFNGFAPAAEPNFSFTFSADYQSDTSICKVIFEQE